VDYIRLYAALKPAAPAINDLAENKAWTYQELDRAISQCAKWLNQSGLNAGDRLACVSKNRAEQLILHAACARIGAIYVPLNWRLSLIELEALIDDCSPALTLIDHHARELGLKGNDINALISAYEALEPSTAEIINSEQPSLMLYTSGTTGLPKGVLHSEASLGETAINFSLLGEVDSKSVFLCESPMFHVIGLVTSIRPAFLRGAQLVISDGFEPQRTLARLADDSLAVTHYFGVPQMAVALRQQDAFDPEKLRHMKGIFTGGAPHPEAQIRDWLNDGLSIIDGYGSSEGGTIFGMPLDISLIDKKAGCVGLPTPRLQARVINNGEEVLDDAPGELEIKGSNLTSGYWRNGEVASVLNDDGWFNTGDIVTRDSDGFYRIVGRSKDMYISGGENVYPAEIEGLLVKHPSIDDVAVVGVSDEKWGEVGCVFYVSDAELNATDFCDFLADDLARYKLPKRSKKVDTMPRNGAGKVVKTELLELL